MKFDRHLFMLCVSEFTGTAILMCIGCAAVVGEGLPFFERNLSMIGLAFGFAVHVAVHTLGPVSGSHINPSVTIAAVMLGNMEWMVGCFYVLSQFLGGLVGYGMLFASLTSHVRTEGMCVTKPVHSVEIWQAILIEFFMASILVYFCCSVWDKRNPQIHDSTSVRFGLLFVGLILSTAPYTGASTNLARSFPPAVFNNVWTAFWIYPVAHVLAAVLVPLAWKFIHTAETSEGGDNTAEA